MKRLCSGGPCETPDSNGSRRIRVLREGRDAKTNYIRIMDAGITTASTPYMRNGSQLSSICKPTVPGQVGRNVPRHDPPGIPLNDGGIGCYKVDGRGHD